MDNLEKLIKELKEAKEELNKNVNASYSGSPNMAGGAMKGDNCPSPEEEDKKMRAVAEKVDDMGDGRAVVGAPSPSPKQADTQMRAMSTKKSEGGEYFSLFKNGQWDVK